MSTIFIAARRQEPQTALQRLFAAAGISLAVLLGLSATADAAIVVSVQQVTSTGTPVNSVQANANPLQQTLTFADLVVSGTFIPEKVSGFQTTLSWTGDVQVTDLYPVNSSGTPVTNASFVLANQTGFLFYNSVDVFAQPAVPASSSRQIEINWAGSFSPENLPTLSTGLTVARLQFAVSAGVDDALFNFTLSDNAFVDVNVDPLPFDNGGGTIAVVPEPGTIPACLLGLVVIGGWITRRSSRQQNSSAPMASAA